MKHRPLRGEAALTIVGNHGVLALPAPSPGPEAVKQCPLLRGQSQQRGNDPEAHGSVAYLASSGRGPLRRRRGASAAAGPTKRRKGLWEEALETPTLLEQIQPPHHARKHTLPLLGVAPHLRPRLADPCSSSDAPSGGPARLLSLPLPSLQLFIPLTPKFPG